MVEVSPDEWVLPNRKGFLDWTYKTFHPITYSKENRLFMHQRFVRDFLQYKSPYRGLMLFHQLGTGKTASSIAAAEGFIKSNKKVVIMTPASLAENYKAEIMKYSSSGKPTKKIWAVVDIKVAGMKTALNLTDAAVRKLGTGRDGRLLVPMTMLKDAPPEAILEQDRAWTTLTDEEKEHAHAVLRYYIDRRYLFINYNGITEKSSALNEFQTVLQTHKPLIIIDEAHNFISRVVNGSKTARQLYQEMMRRGTAKIILLTGTPVINHPFELCMALNLVRGPIRVVSYSILAEGTLPADAEEVFGVLGGSGAGVDEVVIDRKQRQIKVVLKDRTIAKDKLAKVHEMLEAAFGTGKPKMQETYALPTTKEEFSEMFLDEADPDNPRIKNVDVFARRVIGLVSYVKTVGAAYFPRVFPRQIENIEMSKYQFDKYANVRQTERSMDSRKGSGVFGQKSSVYRAFSRMACNFVFPKDIKRKFPKDIRKAAKMAEMDIDGPGEGEGDVQAPAAADIKRLYNEDTEKAMRSLAQHADVYLTQNALLHDYSPKMAKIMTDITNSEGKILLYSQFRTVEGLGIMRLVMEHHGYIQLDIEQKGGEWSIVNADVVLSPEYNGKRFIVFGGDKDKTRILLQLYNATTSVSADLPASLRSAAKPNLRGEFINLLMITQSGAEGISLKCVRRVLIMEPFWNMVRLDQVIGRAVRAHSHNALPEDERNVTVSIYTTVFTPKMAKDFTMENKDNSMTTDTHILSIAEKKDAIIQVFLNQLKIAAVDCRSLAKINEPRENGLSCYAFPIPVKSDEFSYHAYISQDLAQEKNTVRLVRSKAIQGRVVVRKGQQKKYVQVPEYPDQLFDYDAYLQAGVLVPA